MKKLLILLCLILVVTPIILVSTHNIACGKEKPQVILFYTQGCSACKKIKPLYEQMASKFSNKFNFTKQDADKSNLANQLKINTVPTVYIIDPNTQAKTQISYDCLQSQSCFEKKLSDY